MKNRKINFLPIDILEKQFTVSVKGYDAKEVDFFLDLIKIDYENWNLLLKQEQNKIQVLENEKNQLLRNNEVLTNHLNLLKKELKQLESKGLSNLDIIKRINSLEEKK